MKKLAIFSSVLLLLVLTACGGVKPAAPAAAPTPEAPKQPNPVTITFMNTYSEDEEKQLNNVVIPNFQKKYPYITVKSDRQPYDGTHDKLVTAVAGGTTPDVMRMDIIWVPEFAKLGALAPLDSLQGFSDLKGKVFPGALATNSYKGKYYGMPLDTNTQVIIYNPDFLKAAGLSAPPKTMEEFDKYLTASKAAGKPGFAFGGSDPWNLLPFFWSLGGNVTNADFTKATGSLDSDASIQALSTIAGWFKDGKVPMLGTDPNDWDGSKSGKYGAALQGPWYFVFNPKEVEALKLSGAVMPAGPGGSISVVGGEDVVVFNNSKNKDAAWLFVQYLLTDEAQGAMAKIGQMSVTTTGSQTPEMKAVAYYPSYITQLANAKPRTPVPAWNKISKILKDSMESVIRSKTDAKAALTQAAKDIDALLGS